MAEKAKSTDGILAHRINWIVALRGSLAVIFVAVGCFAVVLFTLVHWVERQVLTTNNWVATVAPLPAAPVVTTALGSYITDQLFTKVPIQQQIAAALPPKASFLASPLTTQLKSLSTKIAEHVVAGDAFRQVWEKANRTAMDRLLTNARSPTPQSGGRLQQLYTINLSGVRSKLSSALGTSASALPALRQKSQSLAVLHVNLTAKRQQVWSYVRLIDNLAALLPYILTAALLAALALAYNRRRTLLVVSVIIVVLLLIEIVALKVVRQDILSQVKHAMYHSAVGYIFDVLTGSLHSIIYAWLIASVAIAVACLLTGPTKLFKKSRQAAANKLPDAMIVTPKWQAARGWVRSRFWIVCGAISLLWLLWLAFGATVTTRSLIQYILLGVILIEFVYLFAYPVLQRDVRHS